MHARRCLRVLANLITFLCLCGSGYLIYYVVKRSVVFAAMDKDKVTWMEKNEVIIFMVVSSTEHCDDVCIVDSMLQVDVFNLLSNFHDFM